MDLTKRTFMDSSKCRILQINANRCRLAHKVDKGIVSEPNKAMAESASWIKDTETDSAIRIYNQGCA